jgi:hypothetical protein
VCRASNSSPKEVTLLDYGAGNVRSVRNAIKKLGYTIRDVSVQYLWSLIFGAPTCCDQMRGESWFCDRFPRPTAEYCVGPEVTSRLRSTARPL